MSDRKIEIQAGNLSETEVAEVIDLVKQRNEKKAKLISVLERGQVGDRLQVPLPDNKYGEWVPNDKMEIYRKEAMGFKVDTEFARNRALHDAGAGEQSIVGDCVFMTCDKETFELIEEIERDKFDAMNNAKGGKQKEERDFENLAKETGLPVHDTARSKVDPARLEDIKAALASTT
jgi:hypothetical protein